MAETPDEMRDRLIVTLTARRKDQAKLQAYYDGCAALPWAPEKLRDAYKAMLDLSRTNYCPLAVDAPAQRIKPIGIRYPTATNDETADAWLRYWQSNRLDAGSRMVHHTAIMLRRSFVWVWPNKAEGEAPTITPEHPGQVIVEYAPGDRSTRLAALKWFADGATGAQFCTLQTPEAVYSWTADGRKSTDLPTLANVSPTWKQWADEDAGIVPEAPNPTGRVTMFEFQAYPTMTGEPRAKLSAGLIAVQDRLNKTVIDRMVTSNFASFPQKWATGLDIPQDDDGNDVEPFKLAVERLFMSENPEARFGAFPAADLKGYLESENLDIQTFSRLSKLPHYMFDNKGGDPPSGEALKAAEAMHVADIADITESFNETWVDVTRCAAHIDNASELDDPGLTLLWKDPANRSEEALADAVVKDMAAGVPWETRMEKLGYSPSDIARMDVQRAEDAANGYLNEPEPALP